jgi:hypothetical protein
MLLHHAHAFGYASLLIKFLIDAYPEGVDVKDEQEKKPEDYHHIPTVVWRGTKP